MGRAFQRAQTNPPKVTECTFGSNFSPNVTESKALKTKKLKVSKGGFSESPSGSASSTQLAKLPNVPTFYPDFQNQPRSPRKKIKPHTSSIKLRPIRPTPPGYSDFSQFGQIWPFDGFSPLRMTSTAPSLGKESHLAQM
ncbi:hypothetical protein H5410_057263 [Solanum commersonii]|uniref:Uncharacterized protein n=1 Tax=Solanum commersonii TaxID=4109 RepID=A0A9J5WMI7_SOLCO|nr:hypothetical protein H5410_057263 [Solanum commersonii]